MTAADHRGVCWLRVHRFTRAPLVAHPGDLVGFAANAVHATLCVARALDAHGLTYTTRMVDTLPAAALVRWLSRELRAGTISPRTADDRHRMLRLTRTHEATARASARARAVRERRH